MPCQFDSKATVVNERWAGKYVLVCDVALNERVISGVSAVACPPVKEAEVFLPPDVTLAPDEESKLNTAVLSYYYAIDGSR